MATKLERCPICGSPELVKYGSRLEGACGTCRAKERTRTMYLILRKLDILGEERSVLHIAPEKPLVEKLRADLGERYTICDVRSEALMSFPDGIQKMTLDITSIDSGLAGMRFDVVIHSHVMEHVRASWPLVFLRLHALLNLGGWHLFALPIMRDWSKEDLSEMSRDERRRLYGQHDHVRYIGRRDFEIDMRNIAALTRSELLSASSILSASEMTAIAGDPDVYALRKASGAL